MFSIKKLIFVLFSSFSLLGVINASEKCNVKPEKCINLTCVRNCIDSIDTQIVDLIGQRLSYVKRAGEIKGKEIPIHDQQREDQILEKVGLLAEKQGYSAELVKSIYKIILKESNYFELKYQ